MISYHANSCYINIYVQLDVNLNTFRLNVYALKSNGITSAHSSYVLTVSVTARDLRSALHIAMYHGKTVHTHLTIRYDS